MNHQQAVAELLRQLRTGEATHTMYQRVIDEMELRMTAMHVEGAYDVLGYMQAEATANAYREALGQPPTDITERAKVSPSLTNSEYAAAMASQLPRYAQATTRDTDESDSCHYCGMAATSIGFFGEPVCPECGG